MHQQIKKVKNSKKCAANKNEHIQL